jgi:hypothetical protein
LVESVIKECVSVLRTKIFRQRDNYTKYPDGDTEDFVLGGVESLGSACYDIYTRFGLYKE